VDLYVYLHLGKSETVTVQIHEYANRTPSCSYGMMVSSSLPLPPTIEAPLTTKF
jgi:hypothetical protein